MFNKHNDKTAAAKNGPREKTHTTIQLFPSNQNYDMFVETILKVFNTENFNMQGRGGKDYLPLKGSRTTTK